MSTPHKPGEIVKLHRYHKHTSYCVTEPVVETIEYIWRIDHFWNLYPSLSIFYSGIFPENPKYRILIRIIRDNWNQSYDQIQVHLVLFNYKKELILYDLVASQELTTKIYNEYLLLPPIPQDDMSTGITVLLNSYVYSDLKKSESGLLVLHLRLSSYTGISHSTVRYSTLRSMRTRPTNSLDLIPESKSRSAVIKFSLEGKHLCIRKDVLCSSSETLNAVFAGQKNRELEIQISDVSYLTFKHMLSFIVTGVLPNLNKPFDQFKDLLAAAHKYDIQELKKICEEYFIYQVTVDNAAKIMLIAFSYNAERLRAYTASFIKLHLKVIEATPDFHILSQEYLKETFESISNGEILTNSSIIPAKE